MSIIPEADMAAARDSGADIDVRFAGLQQRVTGIEQAVQGVATQVSNLAATFNDRSRTPWGILFTGAGVMITVMVVLGGLAYSPINAGIQRADRDITETRANALSVTSFLDFKSTYENNRIASRNDNDAKFAASKVQFDTDIKRLEDALKGQVPRAEHERVWTNYDQRFSDIQRQLDEMKASQASTYGVRDVIMDYRERLDRLEQRRLAVPVN
jgi:hypothetical protein